MSSLIQIFAVILIFAIVFRKRILSLINKAGKSKVDKENASTSVPPLTLPDQEKTNVYINAFCINCGEYLNTETLTEGINARLGKELDQIYRVYMGIFIGIDVFTEGDLLLFLIRWQA